MPFTEDLDIFLDAEGFADSVAVDGSTINAIFEDAYVEVIVGSVPYSGLKPTLHGKMSDFAGKVGTTVVCNNQNFTIIDLQQDGSGMVTAILQEA